MKTKHFKEVEKRIILWIALGISISFNLYLSYGLITIRHDYILNSCAACVKATIEGQVLNN